MYTLELIEGPLSKTARGALIVAELRTPTRRCGTWQQGNEPL